MVLTLNEKESVEVSGMTYSAFLGLVEELVRNTSCSGEEKTEARVNATKLNLHRMARIGKQTVLTPSLRNLLSGLKSRLHWVVIAESWCGDGAQTLPVLDKIAGASGGRITLEVVLRDDNPDLMDRFLTNGTRSIPKLIAYDESTGMVTGTWGPRTNHITTLVKKYKTENPDASHDEFVYNLHLWYAKDRGQSLMTEMEELIRNWERS